MKKLTNLFFFTITLAATMAFTKENRCGDIYFGTPWPNQNAYNCINEYINLEHSPTGELYFYALTRTWDNSLVLKSDLAPGQTIVSYINENGGRPEFACVLAAFNSCF